MLQIIKKMIAYYRQRILDKGIQCEIDYSCVFSDPSNIVIGNNVYIGAGTFLDGKGKLYIGDGTVISSKVTILTTMHSFDLLDCLPYSIKNDYKSVSIGRGCWIGINSTILPGVKIEDGAIIGAGAVVTKNVYKGEVVAGNPARVIKVRDTHKIDKLLENGMYLLKLYGHNRRS